MVPDDRDHGTIHEVARFNNVNNSVRSYIKNINTGPAYKTLRDVRKKNRAAGKKPDASAQAGGLITRGWADPQNHASITQGEPLVPGQFYDVTFDLQPDDQIIAAGQRIGLMIFSSDPEFTLWPAPGTALTVDLVGTSLMLPVVGGPEALARAMKVVPKT